MHGTRIGDVFEQKLAWAKCCGVCCMYGVNFAEPKMNSQEGIKTVSARTRSGLRASQDIANPSPEPVSHLSL